MRKSILSLWAVVIVALAIPSCNDAEKSASNGLKYTLVKAGDGPLAGVGEYMTLNMSYKDQNDSVWMNSTDGPYPVTLQKDSSWTSMEGSIYSIFADLKKGDSASFSIKCDDLYNNTFRTPVPPNIDPNALITFNVGIIDVYDNEGFQAWKKEMQEQQMKKMEEEAAEQLEEDLTIIDEYLQQNGIAAQKTESGLSYVITDEGRGENAAEGAMVKVNYTGHVLNGDFFDSSVEEVAKEKGIYNEQRQYGPFEFKLGTGSVIKGWDEGIALLSKGAKATLYIPSPMAYGPTPRGDKIGPNSILIFDVELVDINYEN